MDYISRTDSTVTFLDSCPSELIHSSQEIIISTSLVNFFHVNLTRVGNLAQFKNIRGLERKLGRQQQIIDLIKEGHIVPAGSVCWNYTNLAMENALIFLKQSGFIEGTESDSDIISIATYDVKIGHLKSLAWFSIAITLLTHPLSTFTRVEKKENAFIVLDLLSGDNSKTKRNFDIVNFLLNNTELDEQRTGILQDNGLKGVGLIYGHRNGSTKELKEEFGLTITDWIASSFYNFIIFKLKSLSIESPEYHISDLARTLLKIGHFKIQDPIKLK